MTTSPLHPSLTSPTSSLSVSLSPLVHARIEAAHFCPETGLLALALYHGRKLFLGCGIGPHVSGLGFLPRLPRARAPSTHPLVAALRAHLLDRRVASITADKTSITLTVEPSDPADPSSIPASLVLRLGRRGEAWVFMPSGASVRWPPASEDEPLREGLDPERWTSDLENHGARMLASSDTRALETLRTTLLRAIKNRLKTLERRAEAVWLDLARLDDAPRLQKIGRLLLAQAHSIPRGATRASLVDWESNDSHLLEVTLAPDKPPKIQAEIYFQKARRLQRGASVMQRRLDDTSNEIQELLPLLHETETSALDPSALDALAARARKRGVPLSEGATSLGSKTQKKPERKPFHTFRGGHDRAVLVGRGGKDNDELLTRFARPHDLWLHAKNIHGAHVIVPLEKAESCPADLLVDAATLAAHFSDARGETACEVSYVERRHVRKPRKSAPGAVTFDHEKIITVRIEPERLSRLLASKLDI